VNRLIEWVNIHKTKVLGITIFGLIFLYFTLFQSSDQNDLIMKEELPQTSMNQSALEQDQPKVLETVDMMVDVKGAVMIPGVYRAEPGERVIDLIMRAGGFTQEADQNQVNLSQHIEDEMVVFIPKIGDESRIELELSSGGSVKDKGLLNINKATDSELQTLPGIGPSKSQSIIEFRETNGGFTTIDDLKKISGIGEKTFEKLAELITVK
jgi:competence protein ComEA